MPPFFVLTGGPGAGKTTLIEALRGAGFAGTEEAGRGVIRAQAAIGGPALPGSNPALFAEAMLVWELRNHAEAERANAPTFFDRGLPDIAGYLTLTGLPVPAHVGRAIRSFRYSPVVFCLPPWPEIFVGDRERTQDLPEPSGPTRRSPKPMPAQATVSSRCRRRRSTSGSASSFPRAGLPEPRPRISVYGRRKLDYS
ncbi:MAG: AAA family ATPase [Mesorhizobium sp.]